MWLYCHEQNLPTFSSKCLPTMVVSVALLDAITANSLNKKDYSKRLNKPLVTLKATIKTNLSIILYFYVSFDHTVFHKLEKMWWFFLIEILK